MIETLTISTQGKGLVEFTHQLRAVVQQSGFQSGLCSVFIRHTSASLTIQENADPSVQTDILNWLERQVPEGDLNYTHTLEGPDDMPAHIKSMLTSISLSIPFDQSRLMLGTWQGVYVCEHRAQSHQRQVVVHLMADG